MELLIKDGKIFTPSGLVDGCIGVEDGKIAFIGKGAHLPKAERTIDAASNLVLPGMIDLHVHFRDPGFPEREDFTTGTSAAAAGGVTTVMDMPNTDPPTVSGKAFLEKKMTAEAKAVVDFAICGGVGVKSVDNVLELAKEGAAAFKTFMTSRFEELSSGDDASLLAILRQVSKGGLPCFIHAEDQSILSAQVDLLKKAGRLDPMAHAESRPPIVEAHGALRALDLANEAAARLHLCHTSTSEVVEHALWAKNRGQTVTVETCPQYLLLTQALLVKRGPYAKVDPPLRSEDDRAKMWDMFVRGEIDTLGSDHAPYTVQEKETGRVNIFEAPSGSPGVETTLPLMLDCVSKGALSIERLVQVFSETPAKIARFFPQKGNLQIGADADIVIVDMKEEKAIKGDSLHSKQKYSLFEDWKCKGWPLLTMVRGVVVAEDGEITVEPGHGRFVRPP
jgi:allantoinase